MDTPAEATAARPPSTLYPKITGKLPDILESITEFREENSQIVNAEDSFSFVGTVKLHGSHGDILVKPDGGITCQSRNRTELIAGSHTTDNIGFAAFVEKRGGQVRRLVGQVRERWKTRNSVDDASAKEAVVMFAGEWIGKGVQRGVAIADLSRRFVICGIQIALSWQPMTEYKDIADESVGLFNISYSGFYNLDLHVGDEGESFLAKAKDLTLEVERSCPFGRASGIEGSGEGIVWVPAASSVLPNEAKFWLKTKGEHFQNRPPKDAAERAKEATDHEGRCQMFAEEACKESRLEQGWQYLQEMGIEQNMKGLGTYMKWLVTDIEVEEKREIVELELKTGWKRPVNRIGKEWFVNRVRTLAEEETGPPG